MITINQKHYGTIEVDNSEKDIVQIWQWADVVKVERENIPALIQSILPENKEVKKAEEILDEEISDNLKNILEQSDTPEDLKSFKRYIIDAMERYKSQPALPTKEKEFEQIKKFVDNHLNDIVRRDGYSFYTDALINIQREIVRLSSLPTNKQE